MNLFFVLVIIKTKDGEVMARMARSKNNFGTFYIIQTGGGNRKLFLNDYDRNRFLTILGKAQLRYQFKLYAYCIISEDEYHLILNVNGGDISKIMKSINIAYAMYATCEGKLFKDRYKSELLKNDEQLQELVSKIHSRFQEGSTWNSYCSLEVFNPQEINLVNLTLINSSAEGFTPNFNDSVNETECINCMGTMEEAQKKLQAIAEAEGKSTFDLINDKENRNLLIRDFRRHSTLSLKLLGELFGGLTISSICKILNQ